eukprot:m.56685 g.56685  ORF g.56685 m.56685 type:complete len:64 (-) comp22279_c0_seq1:1058-1249(-)
MMLNLTWVKCLAPPLMTTHYDIPSFIACTAVTADFMSLSGDMVRMRGGECLVATVTHAWCVGR